MKVRCIQHFPHGYNWLPTDNIGGGPGIGHLNDLYHLEQEDWLEVGNSSVEQCIKDNVIPWCRGSFNINHLNVLEENNTHAVVGPNSVFGGNPATKEWFEGPMIHSKGISKILVLNDKDAGYAREINTELSNKKVKRVRHFMRPDIYQTPLYEGEMKWDVLFLVKGNIRQEIKLKFNKWTAIMNPWFQYDELVYKAQRSRLCIVGSQWDTYGLAAHEINCFGCPLVVSENGMMNGNMIDGTMGRYLDKNINSQVIGMDTEEIIGACDEVRQWSRKDVRDAALDFHDPDKLKKIYKDAILGD